MWSLRGRCYVTVRRYEDAVADFTQAIALSQREPEPYIGRGGTQVLLGRYEEGISDLDAVLALGPDPRAYQCRAIAYIGKKQYPRALQDLGAVVRLQPDRAQSHAQIAWLLATCPDAPVRDGKKALEHASKACELVGQPDSGYLETLAAAYAERGDFDQAMRTQESAVELITRSMPRYAYSEALCKAMDRLNGYRKHEPCTPAPGTATSREAFHRDLRRAAAIPVACQTDRSPCWWARRLHSSTA